MSADPQWWFVTGFEQLAIRQGSVVQVRVSLARAKVGMAGMRGGVEVMPADTA